MIGDSLRRKEDGQVLGVEATPLWLVERSESSRSGGGGGDAHPVSLLHRCGSCRRAGAVKGRLRRPRSGAQRP
jgi:hypothetical protein